MQKSPLPAASFFTCLNHYPLPASLRPAPHSQLMKRILSCKNVVCSTRCAIRISPRERSAQLISRIFTLCVAPTLSTAIKGSSNHLSINLQPFKPSKPYTLPRVSILQFTQVSRLMHILSIFCVFCLHAGIFCVNIYSIDHILHMSIFPQKC